MATQSKSGKPAITVKRKISRKKSSSALDNAVKNKAKKVAASSLHDDDDDDELTIEILQKAATEAFTEAAARTMEVMGYNVISKDGWIVKKFADGRIEKISKLGNHHNKPLVLD